MARVVAGVRCLLRRKEFRFGDAVEAVQGVLLDVNVLADHNGGDAGVAQSQCQRVQLLAEAGDVFVRRGHNLGELPIVNVYVARERARHVDRDEAIPLMRAAVDHLFREGRLLVWGVAATGVLVETLLDRGADGDGVEAEAAITRLADAPADDGLVIREICLLRLRALLARAHGDPGAYAHLRDRYCAMAESLGFEGHIALAETMIEGGNSRSGMRRPRSTSSVVVVAIAVSGEAHSTGPYRLRMGCHMAGVI